LKLVNQYIIPFKGLKEGDHEFTFNFSDKFFSEYEVLDSSKGNIEARVYMTKSSSMLSFSVYMEGDMLIPCDRCLDHFNYHVRFRDQFVVKFGENTEESTDEIWILHPNEFELNLEQYFFECLGLSLPIQRVHPEDVNGNSTCNVDMLNILNSHGEKKRIGTEPDPRWNILKKLLDNTN